MGNVASAAELAAQAVVDTKPALSQSECPVKVRKIEKKIS